MNDTTFKARVRLFKEDNIDTDLIYHNKYLHITDPSLMAKYLFIHFPGRENFVNTIRPNDVLVCGKNFGCGSSREHAVLALKYAGIKAVIAESFSRIFYRNAINNAFCIIQAQGILDITNEGDILKIDYEKGVLLNLTNNKKLCFEPLSGLELKILKAGGLINFVKNFMSGETT